MPHIGELAPDFELLNQERQPIRLSDLRGKKVVIFAVSKAHTYGCTKQACGFRDAFPRFADEGAVVLGVSADSPDVLRAWKERNNLPYDLLSDPDHTMLEPWGAWGKKVLFVNLPMTQHSYWVIDENGVLVDQQIFVPPTQGASRALDALMSIPQTEAVLE